MIKRELGIFLIVGSLTVLIDFLTYRGLLWAQWFNVETAKGIGFLTGTVFAYFANKWWTFGHKSHAKGSVWRFILVYSLTLSVNILVNSLLMHWLSDFLPVAWNLVSAEQLFINHIKPVLDHGQLLLNKLTSQEIAIQLAFLVATISSAALNFIGMKLFVFKTKPILHS